MFKIVSILAIWFHVCGANPLVNLYREMASLTTSPKIYNVGFDYYSRTYSTELRTMNWIMRCGKELKTFYSFSTKNPKHVKTSIRFCMFQKMEEDQFGAGHPHSKVRLYRSINLFQRKMYCFVHGKKIKHSFM
ncbi:hypothetical protein RF11_16379 [Thelohanellus kitauei]|uniref:Uncharacterized protein n=1 Tax=Thelohanellus kitauei TaxID=669202 RepID=A0A0C2MGW3_THEKT|nr:hypothetical protein RF11_16379 [Thelohanellus kitauei]